MQYTTLRWSTLLRYCLYFFLLSACSTSLFMVIFADDWRNIFNLKIHVESIVLIFILVIYIAFPFLLARFFYYFYQLVSYGRKDGIPLIGYQTLFNPLNFLFRPSLLTQDGLTHRRRCIISIILMLCLYTAVFSINKVSA